MVPDDPLVGLILHVGLDPRSIALRQVVALVNAEARGQHGISMAAVKLGKAELLVTKEEALAAIVDPETPGDPIRSAETLRAGEVAYLRALLEYGFYDPKLAKMRIDANVDLDKGEVTGPSIRSPTNKRQAGRPSRSEDFKKMLAKDVAFRLAAGEAPSRDKVLEVLFGRDRDGRPVAGVKPVVVLPAGMTSYRTITGMLQWADENAPSTVAEARRQGAIVEAGGQPDAEFLQELLQIRAILANPAAVRNMLRAHRRQKN